jgi:hypothetical protein
MKPTEPVIDCGMGQEPTEEELFYASWGDELIKRSLPFTNPNYSFPSPRTAHSSSQGNGLLRVTSLHECQIPKTDRAAQTGWQTRSWLAFTDAYFLAEDAPTTVAPRRRGRTHRQ